MMCAGTKGKNPLNSISSHKASPLPVSPSSYMLILEKQASSLSPSIDARLVRISLFMNKTHWFQKKDRAFACFSSISESTANSGWDASHSM
uniref:Uncharacterized protein n=1 Tax=Arundo donax TaxID=35708 RepID=A0A0A9GUV7_ARUDO